jgi:hypothetical protein
VSGFYSFSQAIEIIWKNQHPPDCKKAKYLIADALYQGFGAEFHVHGVALALALDMGRVFLPKGGWTWRFKNKFCELQGKNSLECYYQPWSKCTLEDAAYAAYKNQTFVLTVPAVDTWTPSDDEKLTQLVIQYGNKGFWKEISHRFGNRTPTQCAERWISLRKSLTLKAPEGSPLHHAIHHDDKGIADYPELGWQYPFHRIQESTWGHDGHPQFIIPPSKHGKQGFPNDTLVVNIEVQYKNQKFVPIRFGPMLTCAGMKQKNQYLWWRAIAVAYFVRPSQATLKLLQDQQDKYLKNINGQCVSTYIRHGDKAIEMKLLAASSYTDVADQIWKREQLPTGMLSGQQQKVFYVASEDIDAMEQVKQWGRANNVVVRYSNLSQTILSDKVKILNQFDMEKGFPKSREMEYFSYILHLADIVQCEAFICTDPSNYCRVLDALRITVGGKANRLAVDLGAETCAAPPCFRDHPLGFIEDVYDRKGLLWR